MRTCHCVPGHVVCVSWLAGAATDRPGRPTPTAREQVVLTQPLGCCLHGPIMSSTPALRPATALTDCLRASLTPTTAAEPRTWAPAPASPRYVAGPARTQRISAPVGISGHPCSSPRTLAAMLGSRKAMQGSPAPSLASQVRILAVLQTWCCQWPPIAASFAGCRCVRGM